MKHKDCAFYLKMPVEGEWACTLTRKHYTLVEGEVIRVKPDCFCDLVRIERLCQQLGITIEQLREIERSE